MAGETVNKDLLTTLEGLKYVHDSLDAKITTAQSTATAAQTAASSASSAASSASSTANSASSAASRASSAASDAMQVASIIRSSDLESWRGVGYFNSLTDDLVSIPINSSITRYYKLWSGFDDGNDSVESWSYSLPTTNTYGGANEAKVIRDIWRDDNGAWASYWTLVNANDNQGYGIGDYYIFKSFNTLPIDIQFDAPEALFALEEFGGSDPLPAGKYYIEMAGFYNGGGTVWMHSQNYEENMICFTLTEPMERGDQFVLFTVDDPTTQSDDEYKHTRRFVKESDPSGMTAYPNDGVKWAVYSSGGTTIKQSGVTSGYDGNYSGYTQIGYTHSDPRYTYAYDYDDGYSDVMRILVNSPARVMHGCNSYIQSALRQYLNSSEPKGKWWKPMHVLDRPPKQLDDINGYLYGCSDDFLRVIRISDEVYAGNSTLISDTACSLYDDPVLGGSSLVFIPSVVNLGFYEWSWVSERDLINFKAYIPSGMEQDGYISSNPRSIATLYDDLFSFSAIKIGGKQIMYDAISALHSDSESFYPYTGYFVNSLSDNTVDMVYICSGGEMYEAWPCCTSSCTPCVLVNHL